MIATRSDQVDTAALVAELQARTCAEVRFDAGSRALYSTDSSNYRQVPIGVVLPIDTDDVVETISICRQFGVPIVSRGAGTSLAGQTCNVAVVVDFSKYMHNLISIDRGAHTARVQPGLILDDLRREAEKRGLTFGPDPATHNRCTLGGMIGNNSCGVHSVMAGLTSDNVRDLDIITYDGLRMRVGATGDEELEQIIAAGGRRGEIYGQLRSLRDRYADRIRARFPKIPRRVSGFGLEHLLPENGFNVARALVGTEGTCVTVLEATMELVHKPPARALVVLGYPDIYVACDQVPQLMSYHPIGLEGFDDQLIADMKKKSLHLEDIELLPGGGGWLLVEFGGESRGEANDKARSLIADVQDTSNAPSVRLFDDHAQQEQIWAVRESGLGASAFIPGEAPYWPGWEDSAAAPERLGDYLRSLRRLMDQYGYGGVFYGHFGQGCMHTRINFDLTTAAGIDKFRSFMSDAADLVVSYGGSLSGEHGDGQARAELLTRMYGEELVRAFREFKTIWDPQNRMNPGKVVEPYRMDENLRLGKDYRPQSLPIHFRYPEDEGSFAHAALRCVGVGKCRRMGGGTMCPSFMVTREEKHSTRGRARLLFEMLQGQAIGKNGWSDENVKEALDLCLACKGCKSDCPVHVDMATYKAEFMAHYYAGRPRPVTGYLFGFIHWWARLASFAPGLANLFTQSPFFSQLIKAAAHIAPERRIPAFASQTFRDWFFSRERATLKAWVRKRHDQDKPTVILWADTFNNHFTPEPARAAVQVLETAGYNVLVPRRHLCCGRPLYDYGFIDQARDLLRQVLRTLGPQIRAGVPVVGLEPSCIAVFRDELINLFPEDEDARRLSKQSFLLAEFLRREGYQPPPLEGRAIVQGHCHQRAIMGMGDESRVLSGMGLDFTVLDSGCCGMAGAFGFEAGDHYTVSVEAGERVLLPTVRSAPKETLVLADGFSCREQISQTTDRHALHLSQVVKMALDHENASLPYPERGGISQPAALRPDPRKLLLAGAVLSATALLLRDRRSRR